MQFKSLAPRVAPSDRLHQRFALQRGRLTGCYASTQRRGSTIRSHLEIASLVHGTS